MPYKAFADAISCANAAEAVGRLYCASKSKPWPEAPDKYGPGRQPQPPAAYYQRYYVAPLDAVAVNAQLGITTPLPIRIEADAFCVSQQGKQVVTSAGPVTLDFTALVADPVIVTAQIAQIGT